MKHRRPAHAGRSAAQGRVLVSSALLGVALLAAPSARAEGPEVSIAINLGGEVWVEPTTVEASLKPLFDAVARTAKVTYSLRTAATVSDLHRMLAEGVANLGGSSPLTFVQLAEKLKLRPVIKPVVAGSSDFRLLLLVRRSSGIARLEQLKGKTISLPEAPVVHQVYWDVFVAREGIRRPAGFFAGIKKKKKLESSVLDVFLGEADACLIADVVYRAMVELNPQLAKDLVAIHTSTAFSNFPLFATPKMRPDVLERGATALTTLHFTKDGRQLLLMFKIDRLVRTQTSDYKTTFELWEAYKKLRVTSTP